MRTARSLTVSLCVVVSHACPPEQPCMPPTPQSNHACPPGSNNACPPWEQPCTPPWSNHACPPEQPCTPPRSNHICPTPPRATTHPPGATTHAPPGSNHACPPGATTYAPPLWTEWQTGVKILRCPKLRLRAVKQDAWENAHDFCVVHKWKVRQEMLIINMKSRRP